MTGLRRTLGLCVAVAAFQAPSWAARASRADELQDTFKSAIDLLQRGHKDEALKALQKVLAMNPDQKAAYELWKSIGWSDWRDLLTEGPEFELAGKRLSELARAEQNERKNDKDAIQALVKTATTAPDVLERKKAVLALSRDHGEFAVPYLVPFLTEPGSDERTVPAMQALAQMSADVVVPVCEAMKSDNPVLRRNLCMVLGNIGDPRCRAVLQWASASDADETVKKAAGEALARLPQAEGTALTSFLEAGQAYYEGRDTALKYGEVGDVVWDWKGGKLNSTPIKRSLYTSEMSKRMYASALRVDPSSTEALAGLGRSYVDMQSKIDTLTAAGVDVGDWKNRAGEALMAVNTAGVDALDMALTWTVHSVDAATGARLCAAIAPLAKAPTPGLVAALQSSDGAIRSEAAIALGAIAARSGGSPASGVVAALGDAAAREIVRTAVILDGDAARSEPIAAALRSKGVFVNAWTSGARGLGLLRRAPGVDLLLVAESLPDLTTAQVVDEVRRDERLAALPIVVITTAKNAADVASMYADRIQGTLTGPEDMNAVQAALSKEMTGDRARAEDLAARAGATLLALGQRGADLSAGLSNLAAATTRGDKIAIPAIQALGVAGTAAESGALVLVLADDKRSDDARVAAGRALSSLLGRSGGTLPADAQAKVQAVVASSAPMPVREAAAQVVGSLTISSAERAELIRKLRN